jgi:hypothetical protein
MKPTDNVCPSHAIVYRRLATSASSPTRNIASVSTKFSLKRGSAGGKCVYSVILSHDICRLIRDYDPAYTIHYCDFHFPADFRLYLPFPHIFWFLHQDWVGLDGFTLTMLSHVGDEEKTIPSCLDTHSPIIAPPVLPQSAFCALKRTDWPKLDRFKFFISDVLCARRVSAELQLECQSEPMGSFRI